MNKLANLKQEALKLERENVELNQAAEAGFQKYNKLKKKLKTAQAEKKELNGEKCSFQDDLEKTLIEKTWLDRNLAKAEKIIEKLKQQDRDLQAKVEVAGQAIQRLDGQNSSLQVQNNKMYENF